ncbi:hypothetical protein ACGFRG_05730, partial [Streptomyces sp. NPDC048696]
PIALTPKNFAPPGAALATGRQANDQLDVFVVGNDGVLYVLWEANNSAWSQPIALTPKNFAPPGAALATGRQANDQLDVFVVGSDGVLYVLWEANNSAWAQPIALSPARFAPPGAVVASAYQSLTHDFHQLDAFVVGNDGALYVTWEQNNGPWSAPARITDGQFAAPGAPVSAVKYDHGYASVFVPRADKSLCEFRMLEQSGKWTGPNVLSAPGTVAPTARSAVIHYSTNADGPDVLTVIKSFFNIVGLLYVRGDLAGSTQVALEAVQTLRPLTADNPGYRRQLAEWEVSPTVACLAAAARWDEAVTLGEESIGLYQKLAAENPGDDELAYRISWASIEVASKWWAKPELQTRATDLSLRAMENLRTLSARNPAYRRQLAQWLASPTTAFLTAVGRWDEAVAMADESVGLYRKLLAESPGDDELAFQFSASAVDMSLHLWGKPELQGKALDLSLRAMENLRTLCARSPSYRRQLAQWLASPTTAFLTAVGRWDEAVAMADESVGLYRKLLAENPRDDELAFQFSASAVDMALHLWGKPELRPKSIDLAMGAMDSLRPLAARVPRYRPQLADWLISPTSDFLIGTGQKPRAIPVVQEAIDLYTPLSASDPAAYGPKLAEAKKRLAALQT